MTLPASGAIWLSQIKAEFGGPDFKLSSYYRGQGVVPDGLPSNARIPTTPDTRIQLSDFHGANRLNPGSWDQWTPGNYILDVPEHLWLRMRVWGAGGGGLVGPNNNPLPNSGGQSLVAGYLGANGGDGGVYEVSLAPGGSGFNGNLENLTGGSATPIPSRPNSGGGGAGANGGAGGAYLTAPNTSNNDGVAPGGGGGGTSGRGGGGGGFAHSYFGVGTALQLSITVGAGGIAMTANGYTSGKGGGGRVLIEWG